MLIFGSRFPLSYIWIGSAWTAAWCNFPLDKAAFNISTYMAKFCGTSRKMLISTLWDHALSLIILFCSTLSCFRAFGVWLIVTLWCWAWLFCVRLLKNLELLGQENGIAYKAGSNISSLLFCLAWTFLRRFSISSRWAITLKLMLSVQFFRIALCGFRTWPIKRLGCFELMWRRMDHARDILSLLISRYRCRISWRFYYLWLQVWYYIC